VVSALIRKTVLGSMVVLLLSVGTAAPTSASASRTYAAKCFHVAYKPHSILFACADGGFYVKRLHWRHWSSHWAVASGVFHANDCTPDCARGTFHRRRGILLLTRRLACPSIGKFVFRHVTIRYDVPAKGNVNWGHPDSKSVCPM
jgi:hypothetical protein